ncbi:MAG: pseudouridine synthase [Clostridiales bacterium]|nr:pseudouridine synthase [Clostridiales bacterium]
MVLNDPEGIRVNKYIASSGYCSRREADDLITKGLVTIDGQTAVNGSRVFPGQTVLVSGNPVVPTDDHIYIALNKPLGITCTTDTRDKDNIVDFLGFEERIFPIGRLDKNSSGLILLTNDGSIVNKLLRSENGHEKEYLVRVDKKIDDNFVIKMENGLPVAGQITLPCKVTPQGPYTFKIVLTQGLNRQIRRMCEYLGYRVVKLKRIRFMNILLGDMKPGEFRYLNNREKQLLLSGKGNTKNL